MKNILIHQIKKNMKIIIVSTLLLVLLSILSVLPGIIIKLIFDNGINKNNMSYVMKFVIVLLILFMLKSILSYLSNILFSKTSQVIVLNLKKEISSKIFSFPMDFFNSFESGYVTSRIKEIDQLSGLFSVNSFKVLLSILEMVFALFILFKINLILTLILLSLMPIYYVISKKYLSKINDSSYKVAEQNAILNSKMQNTVTGIEEIKNLNVEEKETQKINLESEVLADLSIKQSILFSMGMEFLVFLGSISTVLLLLFGGFSVINNYMTIGGYMIFMNYLPKLYAPMQNISSSILTIQPSLVALKRINEFFELFDIKDNSNEEIEEITEIEFQEVVFSYNTNDKFALEHINFKAKKGDNVLLQGENGSGKSTILKLLIGLYKPKEGEILINNHKFNSYSSMSIRNRIAFVSQKIFLFNTTIRENILYGYENNTNQYENIIDFLQLKELFSSLPDGDRTIVGENGVRLSGGQIQKIAIARALIREADVFMFDEAVSSLDFVSKERMYTLFNEILKDKICIFVSHDQDISKKLKFNTIVKL